MRCVITLVGTGRPQRPAGRAWLARQVVEKMALRFGHNPNVIGWQIGNEYTEDSFDDYSLQLFHEWLKAKYKTLDSLNAHWTTAYWSETYDRWDEIPFGRGRQNPGLLLDYKRFVSDQWRDFSRNQLKAIPPHSAPRQFITPHPRRLGGAGPFHRHENPQDLYPLSWGG